jgi:hypothetical protein
MSTPDLTGFAPYNIDDVETAAFGRTYYYNEA